MCGALALLKIHFGLETREDAKAKIAQRFLDMYYKYFGRQNGNDANSTQPQSLKRPCIESDNQHSKEKPPTAETVSASTESQWLSANTFDVSMTVKIPDHL